MIESKFRLSRFKRLSLDEVTYLKVMGTGGKQVYANAKTATRWVADRIGIRNSIDDTPALSTPQVVLKRAEFFRKSPDYARKFVFETLATRLQVPPGDIGLLSTRLIEEAAAGYGLREGLLLSQLAEAIAKKYIEDCIEGVQERLKKQSADEIRVTEDMLAKQIATMTPAERLEIQKALNLQNLSGSSMRSAFISTGLPIAGIAALQAGGFGTYLALTTILHAVFTGMLGITLPFAAYTGATSALSFLTGPAGILISFSLGIVGYIWGQRKIERSQYAMIVWTCVWHAEGPIAPPTGCLPSSQKYKLLGDGSQKTWSSPEPERQDFLALEQERREHAAANKALVAAETQSDSLESRIRKSEERIRKAEQALAISRAKVYSEATVQDALRKLVAQQQSKIKNLNAELDRLKQDAESAKAQVLSSKQANAQAEKRYVSRLERRSKELASLWAIHYPKIDFQPQPLRWAAEQDFAARLEIERALKELADAPDPVKLSRSRMHATGEHHSRFTIPDRVECRLFYVVQAGQIEIQKMCKKKDV